MNTALRIAPHYFIIDSIGGMNEGYSDTTCRRVEDVVTPELGKALVEEYIDQWIHGMIEHFTNLAEEQMVPTMDVKYNVEECPRGGWVKLTPKFSDNTDPEDIEDWGDHTLFIQVYDGMMLGDAVVVYDQMDDMVRTITTRSTAIRMAEECISIEVERIKARLLDDKSNMHVEQRKYYTNSLIYSYDCLADVVRDLEYPQEVMVDIDDTCTHYFPVEKCKRLIYLNGSRIQTETEYA